MFLLSICLALSLWEPDPRLSDLDRFFGDAEHWNIRYDMADAELKRLRVEWETCGREWRGCDAYYAAERKRVVCDALRFAKDTGQSTEDRRNYLCRVRDNLDPIDYLAGRVP